MTTFNELLNIWYDGEIARLYDINDRGDGRLMLGCPVWGKDYVERLVEYCLPSIASGENLTALSGRARLVLFVDHAHLTDLAMLIRNLEHKGIELRIRAIPEEIIKEWRETPKEMKPGRAYQILGTAQDILVHTAGRQGMSFHMLMPDHTYNARYFPNYFRLTEQHEAITQLGICADVGPATDQFKTFRQPDGGLVIPDRDLGNIAFRNLHKRMKPFLMNDESVPRSERASIPDRMPGSHFVFWQGRAKLVLSSCHMNPARLSARLCAKAPKFFPATMDACLPALTAGTTCYVPTADDGLTFIELSGEEKQPSTSWVPFSQFATNAWGQARFRDDYLWFTRQRSEIPIKPQARFLTDEQIEQQHADVIDRLVAGKGSGASLEFAMSVFRRE